MSNKKAFRSALYLSMMVSLAACGGGGSSSNNSSGGKLMLDSGGYAERKVSIGKQSDVSAALEIYETSLAISELMWDVEREIDTWGEPEENGNVYTLACKNSTGSGTVVITYRGNDLTDDEHWQFTNCEVPNRDFGPLLLNGAYRYVEKLNDRGDNWTWNGYGDFNISGRVLNSGKELKILGRESWDGYENDYGDYKFSYRTGALELVLGEEYLALSNVTLTELEDRDNYSSALNGRLISSAMGGYIHISTPTPIQGSFDSSCPNKGVERIESDGYVEIRYGSDTGRGDYGVVVEINNNFAVGYETCHQLSSNL